MVGLGTAAILRGLLVEDCSSTRVPSSLVDWDCGIVGAAAARSGAADKGLDLFKVEIDRDSLWGTFLREPESDTEVAR